MKYPQNIYYLKTTFFLKLLMIIGILSYLSFYQQKNIKIHKFQLLYFYH